MLGAFLNRESSDEIISYTSINKGIIKLDNNIDFSGDKASIERIAAEFIEGITYCIAVEYNVIEELDRLNVDTTVLASGIYQVFKDNKLDKLIRSVV